MLLSLVIFSKLFFLASKVNIYLQNMNIKRIFSLFLVCSLSPSMVHYSCPNIQTTCAMALIFTPQYEFVLSKLPSIPSNGYVGGLC